MKAARLACLLALAGAAASASAAETSLGGGSAFTAGSGGYWRLAVFGDIEAERGDWLPYGWTSFSVDNYQRQFGFGGGAWRKLTTSVKIKGGLGLLLGRIDDSGESGRSLVLETGIERKWRPLKLGGEYRLTAGTIGGPSTSRTFSRSLRDELHSRRSQRQPDPEVERYSYHELSGYARLPLSRTSLTARLTVGIPSRGDADVSQTLTWMIPVNADLALTPGVTFQQESEAALYGTIGVYYLFW